MRALVTTALILCAAASVIATDVAFFGTKLAIREPLGRESKLDVTLRDSTPAIFPPAGSDPSLTGLTIDLVVDNGGGATMAVPGGADWKVTSGSLPSFTYRNRDANPGASVRKLVLRQGKLFKMTARGVTVGAESPAGGAWVTVTLGSDRLCGRFDATYVARDEPGRLVFRKGSGLAGCPPPPSSTSTTTSTSTSSSTSTSLHPPCDGGDPGTTCGGACPSGSSCQSIFSWSYPPESCICVPDDVTACGGGYPACGGACDGGNVCAPFRLTDGSTSEPVCACVSPNAECAGDLENCTGPGLCADGLVCAILDAGVFECGCTAP